MTTNGRLKIMVLKEKLYNNIKIYYSENKPTEYCIFYEYLRILKEKYKDDIYFLNFLHNITNNSQNILQNFISNIYTVDNFMDDICINNVRNENGINDLLLFFTVKEINGTTENLLLRITALKQKLYNKIKQFCSENKPTEYRTFNGYLFKLREKYNNIDELKTFDNIKNSLDIHSNNNCLIIHIFNIQNENLINDLLSFFNE